MLEKIYLEKIHNQNVCTLIRNKAWNEGQQMWGLQKATEIFRDRNSEASKFSQPQFP